MIPELRLTLLLLGVLFLAGLAWWELRRPRQARGADLERPPLGSAVQPQTWGGAQPEGAGQEDAHQPGLALPHLSAREPLQDLPVIEMPPGPLTEPVSPAVPQPAAAARTAANGRLDPTLDLDADLLLAAQTDSILMTEPPLRAEAGSEAEIEADAEVRTEVQTQTGGGTAGSPGMGVAVAGITAAAADGTAGAEPAPCAAIEPGLSATLPPGAEPIVAWPQPEHSRIVAVRVVAPAERFQGRAVRQALAAQGFVLGRFAIFHKAAHDGRALLSAASLTKPGTFDADSIDMQRFSGLNLFAVLPGPLPGPAAIDELLLCAHTLRERLRGVLQDDRGAPLTASRTTVMRESASIPP